MNKYEKYEELKRNYEKAGVIVGTYKEINYGIQFGVQFGDFKGTVRVYESKKKGISIDFSQVRAEELVSILKDNEFGELVVSNDVKKEGSNQSGSLIGVDESGKGDYFGPLVIAGVYASEEQQELLKKLGIMDSKKLSDGQIERLAALIKDMCSFNIICLHNVQYNKVYNQLKNLNVLLAKAHAKIIDTLATENDCLNALSDQFAKEEVLQKEMNLRRADIKLTQKHRAEDNVVVAAASILARDEFVKQLRQMEAYYGVVLPKGAGPGVLSAGRCFVERYTKDRLSEVAKIHFKTTDDL